MKKFLCLILALAIVFSFSACKNSVEKEENVFQTKKIAVVLYDENEYDLTIKNTFIETLNTLFVEEKLSYNVLNAKGNDDNLQNIVASIKADETLIVVPVGLEASKAVNQLFNGQLPIFFANVTNPVLSGLMSDITTPSTTTGVVSTVPADYIFNNFTNSIGDNPVGHIGVIFNTSEISPMETVNDFKSHLDSNNYYYTESVVATSLEAQQAASKMLYKAASGSSVTGEQSTLTNISKKYENRSDGVNMLFLSGDKVVNQAAQSVAKVLNDSDYYVYTANPESVVGENFVSLTPTASSIGAVLADMVSKYFNGASITTLPCQTALEFEEIKYDETEVENESDSSKNNTPSTQTSEENTETNTEDTSTESTSENQQ